MKQKMDEQKAKKVKVEAKKKVMTIADAFPSISRPVLKPQCSGESSELEEV